MSEPVRIIGSYLSDSSLICACFFRDAAFARFAIDVARWPRTAALVARVLATPSFQTLETFEDCLLTTPIPQAREALAAIGAPIMRDTYGTSTPRRGIMPA